MDIGTLDGPRAVIETRFARVERLWNDARKLSPALHEIGSVDRLQLVARFARLDRQLLKEDVATIRAGRLAQIPQGAMGEMRVIRGEIGKKRAYIALRKLFSTAATAIQRIKPVLLMSPVSVAQFLPPGALTFDLLVIDEASQVRPEDALGAIARAHQIVVVGDQKQLPPTSFFDCLPADENNRDEEDKSADTDLLGGAAKVDDLESILSLCEARGLNSRMLRLHYRSRDPSLIRLSNREFYGDGLILYQAP
jgi:AAA domain